MNALGSLVSLRSLAMVFVLQMTTPVFAQRDMRGGEEARHFHSVDRNGDDVVSFREYEMVNGKGSAAYDARWVKACFDSVDRNRDGMITHREHDGATGAFRGILPLRRGRDEFERADVIGDGMISVPEYSNWQAQQPEGQERGREVMKRFNAMDLDRNLVITRREYAVNPRAWFGQPAGRPSRPDDDYSRADADCDDRTTRDEYYRFRGHKGWFGPARELTTDFDRLDTNRDGIISRREYEGDRECFIGRGGRGHGELDRYPSSRDDIAFRAPYREVHSMNDSNGDGVVTWREYEASNRGRNLSQDTLSRRFRSIDLDGNGRLTLSEFEHYQRATQGR